MTPEFVVGQLERFENVYGPPRDRSEIQILGQAREWYDALAGFGCEVVKRAFTWTIAHHKTGFWPSPGVVVERCTTDTREWTDALTGHLRPATRTPEAREDITPEYRAAVCQRLREQHAEFFTPEACVTEPRKPIAPAGPNERVSPQLEAWARKVGLWRGPANEDWRTVDDVA